MRGTEMNEMFTHFLFLGNDYFRTSSESEFLTNRVPQFTVTIQLSFGSVVFMVPVLFLHFYLFIELFSSGASSVQI